MNSILIVGGRQKKSETRSSNEWSRFGQAVAVAMDPETGVYKELVSHITPEEARATDEYSVLYKSSWVEDGVLFACTQTEIMRYDLATGEELQRISLPTFNDVHHVRPSSTGGLWVVSTGLDLLLEIDHNGDTVREFNAAATPTWERFDRATDYRRVASTKPHQAHPNFVFEHGGEVWLTRFEQKDAICVTNPSRRIDIGVERPHDGVVVGDLVHFTTVDGHLVTADLTTDAVVDVVDVHEFSESDSAIGWMRGLSVLDDGHVLLGFSTLRVTKFRENIRWVKKRAGKLENHIVLPTHVSRYDIPNRKLIWRRELSDPVVDVVFSVLAV